MKKENKVIWSKCIFVIIMIFVQLVYLLTGNIIPNLVIWFSNVSYIVFLVSIFIRLTKKSARGN